MARGKNDPQTLGELLYWSYSNLAMAHAAISKRDGRYGPIHFMIRARLYKGLCTGSMSVGSLLDDERLKMTLPRACAYCGSDAPLTLDHLVPRIADGPDTGDNVVWACRSCNSSKCGRDFLEWMNTKQRFPPLLLLRRYLKLALQYAEHHDLLHVPLSDEPQWPFSLARVPTSYPRPSELLLWVDPVKPAP